MILELCKGVHCVDLGKSFPTHIYLQNLASIQPRASPLKFAVVRAAAGRLSASVRNPKRARRGAHLLLHAGHVAHVLPDVDRKLYADYDLAVAFKDTSE